MHSDQAGGAKSQKTQRSPPMLRGRCANACTNSIPHPELWILCCGGVVAANHKGSDGAANEPEAARKQHTRRR